MGELAPQFEEEKSGYGLEELSQKKKTSLIKGIVAFELETTSSDLECLEMRQRNSGSSDSEEPQAPAETAEPTHLGKKMARGTTYSGKDFFIPETLNTASMFYPQNFSLASLAISLVTFSIIYLTLFCNFSVWLNVFIFAIFRAGYNVFLGVILRSQSLQSSFTKWYIQNTQDPNSNMTRILHYLALKSIKPPHNFKISDFPAEFCAWLVFKNLVTLILFNDGFSYALLGLKCFTLPSQVDFWLFLQYGVGLFLTAFNYWAKVDAHRCIGEYCWYWGDFFFRKNENLTFDGIFELFPHPMYTVGYSSYYGISLLSSSYLLFFVSLIAHMSQLIFLAVVEEPHIARIYGGQNNQEHMKKTSLHTWLFDPHAATYSSSLSSAFHKPSFYFLNFHPFKIEDICNLLLSIFTILIGWCAESPFTSAWVVLFWRIIHWGVLGTMLYHQSKYQYLTRYFRARGKSVHDAFSFWYRIYNISQTLNFVSFIICFLRVFFCVTYPSFGSLISELLLSPQRLAFFSVGILLCLLSVWAMTSMLETVGEFGWFYGDFFWTKDAIATFLSPFSNTSPSLSIPPVNPQVYYTGIYRFLNNPDLVLGSIWLYGLAMIGFSWTLFSLALLTQGCMYIFLQLVEIPHMNKLYDKEKKKQKKLNQMLQQSRSSSDSSSSLESDGSSSGSLDLDSAQLRKETPHVKILKQKLSELESSLNIKLPSSPSSSSLPLPQQSIQNLKQQMQEIKTKTFLELSEIYIKISEFKKQQKQQQNPNSSAVDHIQLEAPEKHCISEPLTIKYRFDDSTQDDSSSSSLPASSSSNNQAPTDLDWIGIYKPECPSAPGMSDGKWLFVQAAPKGQWAEVTFPVSKLPSEGIYEVRYHRSNTYNVSTSKMLVLLPNSSSVQQVDDDLEDDED